MHDFPEHYGEVLLIVLKGCSEKKLMASILLELLNTIYKFSKCSEIDLLADSSKTIEQVRYFAANQRIFAYQELYETMALFARHFQDERLQHGLHGLYVIHKDYCPVIAVMLETFGYSLIVSAVHTNPGALSDTRKLKFILSLIKIHNNILFRIFQLSINSGQLSAKCFRRGYFPTTHKICQIYRPIGYGNSTHRYWCRGANSMANTHNNCFTRFPAA